MYRLLHISLVHKFMGWSVNVFILYSISGRPLKENQGTMKWDTALVTGTLDISTPMARSLFDVKWAELHWSECNYDNLSSHGQTVAQQLQWPSCAWSTQQLSDKQHRNRYGRKYSKMWGSGTSRIQKAEQIRQGAWSREPKKVKAKEREQSSWWEWCKTNLWYSWQKTVGPFQFMASKRSSFLAQVHAKVDFQIPLT